MNLVSVMGGLAGAAALTLVNETVKRVDKDAPRLDLLGRNAAAKLVGPTALKTPAFAQKLFPAALAGDLVSNTLYFSMAQGETKAKTLIRGSLLGLSAGLGAAALANPLGLAGGQPTSAPAKTNAMTIAYYVLGGLVAAAMINLISKEETPQEKLTV
jgi:hypothetical protein